MANNASGLAALRQMISQVRDLGEFPAKVAPKIAQELESELIDNIATGVGPDGEPWKPTREGNQPLKGAAKSLKVVATGTKITATVSGIHARHHLGAVKGGIRREILPTKRLPQPAIDAIRRVLEAEWARR